MLMINVTDVTKTIDSKNIFEDVAIQIYEGDRIGLVGKNGSGKTTLLNMLMGYDMDYKGVIDTHCTLSCMPQLAYMLSGTRSGGEYTKDKIYKALRAQADILILDEPTSNLDMDSIMHLERQLTRVKTSIIISHDEGLLASVCNKIMAIEHNEIKTYSMDYETYKHRIENDKSSAQDNYESYLAERAKLSKGIKNVKRKAKKIKKAPSRMGNSEARLHKREAGERRSKIEAHGKSIESRLSQLTIIEKPFIAKEVRIEVLSEVSIHSQLLIDVYALSVQFGSRMIFNNARFKMENYQKIWLQGCNGSGKSTFLKMIIEKDEHVNLARNLKIGFFDQKLEHLNYEATILENVMDTSSRGEQDIRTILGNMLFRRDDVYKAINILSGGELDKVAFAKILLSDINLLILDEPTNYLDIETRHVMLEALKHYEGAILFVTHDRAFGNELADWVYEIKNLAIHMR
ncbi:MAG: ATP-binding cassette domain-containing protein [Vallitaleaceae bacterium]|jgi:macrolide transport system ATP-binding/permease protein|nr:ATP-binding cassette domain-containing protein [Vallitaleaceae bacterium]